MLFHFRQLGPVQPGEIQHFAVPVSFGTGVVLVRAAQHQLADVVDPGEEASGKAWFAFQQEEVAYAVVPQLRSKGEGCQSTTDDDDGGFGR
ncbi:hypothetical protein H340_03339 [Streptomyces mobaraensis NBRC 13819 = DSM 40847]|uniref:Uncharacterized protein n=1 Tax=Streptomyces mobaraensis (strain ATCC 29032 / DSM 40847 / JCM 4168 / NBRC 13819 / NCIMB 11159 / IPCR 16-22) TaxID=1223523 RepID=M3B7P3_STRM1|nr:hypothetical protein H340_03339 [Streptomyces mobaraensis NBRC 13819 = DSM 40847]